MNKNRRPLAKKTRKALEKEIKKGQKELSKTEDLPRTDTLTTEKALEKYPAKKPLVDSVKRKMAAEKKKKASKHSKRTSPGEVDHRESSPAHPHTENERWKKTVDMQNKVKGKILDSKLQKGKNRK
ncbi:MAG: hypothetical protein P0S96_06065 [Simkaniaceae bacterium]|nr:hypothetical protein [Candidatus Sacchlamyda saccharinae]